MKNYYKATLLTFLLISPIISNAQSFLSGDFRNAILYASSILDLVVPILFILAFIFFFWGLSKFILNNSGNQADLKKGKDFMLWSLLALFILVSYTAIIGYISKDLEIGNGVVKPIQLPGVRTNN